MAAVTTVEGIGVGRPTARAPGPRAPRPARPGRHGRAGGRRRMRGLPWGETLPPDPPGPVPRGPAPARPSPVGRPASPSLRRRRDAGASRCGLRAAASRSATSASRSMGWTTATRTWPLPSGPYSSPGLTSSPASSASHSHRAQPSANRVRHRHPQVEAAGRAVDRQPGSVQHPGQEPQPLVVAAALLVHVGVVVEGHHRTGLDRARHHQAGVAPDVEQVGDQLGVPGVEARPAPRPGWTASTASGRPPRRRARTRGPSGAARPR